MKFSVLSSIVFLVAGNQALANGGPISSGTARVDEKNLKTMDSVSEKRSGERRQTMREKAARNPRNRSFSGSFEKVGEPEQERMEDNEEGIEDLKDDPFYKKRTGQ